MDKRVNAEIRKINKVLKDADVTEYRRKSLQPIIENAAYMRIKLLDTIDELGDSDICVPYDNGGGQIGIRENPLFKGYKNLFKTYMLAMGKILDSLPEEKAEEVLTSDNEKPQTILELVRSKKQA